jgi:hypothetical protein
VQSTTHARPPQMDWLHLSERVLRLALPNTYAWLGMFYCLFHLWLNILAELLCFGDREFYKVRKVVGGRGGAWQHGAWQHGGLALDLRRPRALHAAHACPCVRMRAHACPCEPKRVPAYVQISRCHCNDTAPLACATSRPRRNCC